MEPHFLARLPNDLQELVRTTEHEIGFEIGIVVDPGRAHGVPGEPDPLACEVDAEYARLLIPSQDQFAPGSVYHELLHIRRFLVEGVPCITDCEDYEGWTPQVGTALVKHDNCIEHLVIVTKELQRFPGRRQHWEDVMGRVWTSIVAGEDSALDREQAGLANWAFLKLVLPDSPSVPVAWEALGASNLQERAGALCEALSPVLDDKAAAVRVWFQVMGIPLEIASLKYFAPQEGRTWEVSLNANA